MSRRRFLEAVAALGVSAPWAAAAQADDFVYRGERRGGGGVLKILSWQGPTILNQHFASGAKDVIAARCFYEPLAHYTRDGALLPVLLADLPTLAGGGIARDGRSMTLKLKPGVQWHDGEPFTAEDVVFTIGFAGDPAAAAFTVGNYRGVTARALDRLTVRLEFDAPRPAWDDIATGQILPRKHFAAYAGSRSREAPANLRPVGTGPYRIVDFRPGDFVRGEANPAYHMPGRPHFAAIEIKGGGDSVSAARAVLQTGDYDIAWQLQVEDDVLQRLERGGRGRIEAPVGGDVEYLMLNHADPWSEFEGERAHPQSRHPFLLDPAVRGALARLVDRESIERYVMGRGGVATTNFVNNPAAFTSKRQGPAFDVARANALLDAGGWVRGADGVRAKGGRRLKMLFQTSTNPARLKVQATIKAAAERAGIEMELKATVAAVYFSSDAGNPDTAGRFLADLQMHTLTRAGPDPGRFLELFCSWQASSKANKWIGRNQTRYRSEEYDRTFRAAEQEMDPVKRAALLVRLNDIVCDDFAVIPIFVRPKQSAVTNSLVVPLGGWGAETGRIHDWYRA